ncbi:MAG TPA: DUF6090 family protein [Flavipsychrobacter sp.]|nr:DUF6090 family protein [Flavipsychrobacter sp.]
MHDEITKHTKNIYNEVKSSKHSFGEKVKEILVEIFIIVFAVTISIWLHNWSEHRHQQKEVREFLADLTGDLKDDVGSMKSIRDTLSKQMVNCLFFQNLTQQQCDSLEKVREININLNLRIAATLVNIGDYEGFKSGGKMGYIEDKKLKKMILIYYEQIISWVTEMDNMNTAQTNKFYNFIEDHANEKDWSKIALNPKFKMIIKMASDQMNSSCNVYDYAINYANEIIAEIDRQKSE